MGKRRGIKRCQENLIEVEEKKKSMEKTDIYLLRYISVLYIGLSSMIL